MDNFVELLKTFSRKKLQGWRKCSNFEHLPWLASQSATHANSLVVTFAKCSPYAWSLENICKNRLCLVICYPILHFQASLNEYCIPSEIDKSIIFCKYSSLYLRMCIFCCTFAAYFLGKSGQNIMFFLEKTDIILFYLKEKTDKIRVIIWLIGV